MSAPRLLVVEDDSGLRDVLARGLRAESFEVVVAVDGAGALLAADERIDAIVLDIGLPDSDGRDVCQALRARGVDAPVVFLTARRDTVDRLSGFASGGDDYLPKPFAFPELVARLRAMLRRRPLARSARVGDLLLDPVEYAICRGGERVRLAPTEFRLLARLMAAEGEVVRRGDLRAAGWAAGAIVSDNTLDQYIKKMRHRLDTLQSPLHIRTVRGVGYELS